MPINYLYFVRKNGGYPVDDLRNKNKRNGSQGMSLDCGAGCLVTKECLLTGVPGIWYPRDVSGLECRVYGNRGMSLDWGDGCMVTEGCLWTGVQGVW